MKKIKLILILLFAVFSSCVDEIPVKTYTITKTVTPEEGGEIKFSPEWLDAFNEGQRVAVIPVANEGWVFQEWQGDANGTSIPYFFDMNSNKNIIGVFVKKPYPLAVIVLGEGTVTETIVENPSGREYFPGTIVELNPVPKEGWVFESWGGALTGNEKPKRITVEERIALTARFVPQPQGAPKFYLGENGITCKCENVIAGDKGLINGVEYEAVNIDFLVLRISEKKDLTRLCTSLVTDMSNLFSETTLYQPIQNWDVSNVTNMEGMFFGSVFNQPIGDWDVSNVTNMKGMFVGSDFNQPIGDWDVSNVTNMDYLFNDNFDFNQDLSKWCVEKIPKIPEQFATAAAWTLPKPVWGTCPD